MKCLRLLNILPIGLFIFVLLAFPAMADTYNVDGYINDWGVDLSAAYGNPSNVNGWYPTGHDNVDFIVENNNDPYWFDKITNSYGRYSKGTHKQRNGDELSRTSISDYIEAPFNGNTLQPSGGEICDLEALYFDDDNEFMYIALVTSVNPAGTTGYSLGDIALNIDNTGSGNSAYEYGVDSINGNVEKNPTWDQPTDFPNSDPRQITGGEYKGRATVGLKQVTIREYYGTGSTTNNWVLEAKIPKSLIDKFPADGRSGIHITISCGNDEIELIPIRFKHNIPEFPTIVLPVAAVMGIILILGRRKNE